MHGRRWLLAILVTASLAGCGNRNLVLKVDVLSYLDPVTTQASFGPVPALPEGVYTGEQTLVKDAVINLIENADALAEIKDLSLAMSVVADDSTGAGSDTMRVYMADVDTDPLTTPPAMVMPLTMTSGLSDTARVELAGDQRLVDLFRSKHVRVCLTTALRGPTNVGGEALNGRIRVSALDAVVVAGRKGM